MKWITASSRRLLVALTTGGALAIGGLAPAQAQVHAAYPSKPIRLIAPFAAGGSIDALARDIARHLQERWGQPVVVDNRPGGAGSIGTAALAKSPPDGYTILLANSGHVINPHVYAKLPFDAIKDFTPVITTTSLTVGLFVHNSVPVRNVAEFVAMAKAKPGDVSFASSGTGGASHLAGAMFMAATGTSLIHTPYKGSAPAVNDLVGGHVQAMFADMPAAMPHVRSGALRLLAVTSKARQASAADVPTFAEAGVQNMELSVWSGILAPAGTPRDVVQKLNLEIGAIVREPAVANRFTGMGFEMIPGTPEDYDRTIRADFERYGAVVRRYNIKAD
jgi:tripartite-type tricarboxylate transporter receptor subunit TctC